MRRFMMACIILCLAATPWLCAAMEEDGITDGMRFKQEYEQLNGQSNLDGTNVYQTMDIPESNGVKYADMDAIRALFESGSGILYLGFPECPWCRTLVPTLIQAVGDAGYGDTLYYYNALYDRDKKHLDDQGNIVTDEPGTEAYQYLLEKLNDHLGVYEGLNDETVKRVYYPTTVFIKDGQVMSVHIDTVDSQTDGYASLEDAQRAELYELIMAQISALHSAPPGNIAPQGAIEDMNTLGVEDVAAREASDSESPLHSEAIVEVHAFAYDHCGGCDGQDAGCGACDEMLRLNYMLTIPLKATIKQGDVRLILHNVITDEESEIYERAFETSGLSDADYRVFPTAFIGEVGKEGVALVGAQAIREGVARAVGTGIAAYRGE